MTTYNKVTLDGTTLMDISDTTAVAADVALGKYFYTAGGAKTAGTATIGNADYVRTVIAPLQTLTPTSNGTTYSAIVNSEPFEEDESYIITYNGDEYLYTCQVLWATNYVLGDQQHFFGTSADFTYPFGIIYESGGQTCEIATTNGNSVTVKIEKIELLNGGTTLMNKTITSNGTYSAENDNADGYSEVTVNVPSGQPSLQSKTATPTESQQTITADNGYDGLSSVLVGAVSSTYIGSGITRQAGSTITPSETAQTVSTSGKYMTGDIAVNAISSTYVGSGIDRRTSSNLTASGATVTAPAGYYASAASKAVASGSASTPATTVTANPSISVSSAGLITATASATKSVTPTVSAGYVSSGTAGTITVSGSNTQQLSTQAAQTITPTTTNQTIASGKYLTGAQTIKGDANLVASNILSGVSIFGVQGSVSFQTIYSGSAAPSSSTGINGDIYIQTS